MSSTGMLTYDKEKGVKTDENGKELGSKTARGFMMNAMDHEEIATVNIDITGESYTEKGTNDIYLSINQIQHWRGGANNVSRRTMGWGMTLMHETYHTNIGGGLLDTPNNSNNPGPVVNQMNKIRSGLNAQGLNYGERMSYDFIEYGKSRIIPFNAETKKNILNGNVSGSYIIF